MKHNFVLLGVFLLLSPTCNDGLNGEGEPLKVVRDCTGTYVQIENEDYLVCNSEELADISDGTTATIAYEIVDECPDTGGIVCMMYHEHSGNVTVQLK